MVELFKKHPLQAKLVKLQNDIEKLYKQASKQGFADGEVKYSTTHSGENLYDTPNSLKPTSEEEWHSFIRSFANKTNDLKKDKRRSIIIYTEDYAYYITADGYLSGVIESKINLNDDYYERVDESGFDTQGSNIDSYFESYGSRQGNNSRNISSAKARKRDGRISELADGTPRSRRADDIDGSHKDSQEFEAIEKLPLGTVVFDGETGYAVRADAAGNKYLELLDEAGLNNSTFSNGEKYSLDVAVDKTSAVNFEVLDKYTEKTYNERGWVTVNNVLTKNEQTKFYSQFADSRLNKFKYPTTPKGETIITVGDKYSDANVLVFAKGTNKSPIITKIVRINVDEIEISIITEELIEYEQNGVEYPYEAIENYAGKEVFNIYTGKDSPLYRQLKARKANGQKGRTTSNDDTVRENGARLNTTGEAGLDNSAFSNGEKYSLDIDNKNDKRYNINNETNRKAESNGRTNEFRELQKRSRRMSDEEVQLYHSGKRQIDESLRRRFSRSVQSLFMETNDNGVSNADGLLNLSAKGNEFQIYKNVDADVFHDVFEIVQKYLRNLISNLLQ